MTSRTNAQVRTGSPQADDTAGAWLSLRQAAALVGVHPSTLRRWSNEGRLASFRTPGGHRRFLRSQVQNLVAERPRLRAFGGLEGLWTQQVDTLIRSRRPFEVEGRTFEGADISAMREYGRDLLGLIRRAAEDRLSDQALEHERARLGGAYASWSLRHHVPADQMLGILSRVRQAMVDAALDLAEDESLEPQAIGSLLRQVHHQLDGIEMVLIRSGLAAAAEAAPTG